MRQELYDDNSAITIGSARIIVMGGGSRGGLEGWGSSTVGIGQVRMSAKELEEAGRPDGVRRRNLKTRGGLHRILQYGVGVDSNDEVVHGYVVIHSSTLPELLEAAKDKRSDEGDDQENAEYARSVVRRRHGTSHSSCGCVSPIAQTEVLKSHQRLLALPGEVGEGVKQTGISLSSIAKGEQTETRQRIRTQRLVTRRTHMVVPLMHTDIRLIVRTRTSWPLRRTRTRRRTLESTMMVMMVIVAMEAT